MRRLFAIAIAAVALVCGGGALAASFSLKVDTPKNERSKSSKGDENKVRNRRRGTASASESVTTVSEYPCRISCSLAYGETSVKATLEAFFILRENDGDSSRLRVEPVEGGTFTFTPQEKTHEKTITSPACTRTTVTKSSGPRRRRKVDKETTGTSISGIVVRVVCDGKVVAVKCLPDNSAWKRAAKQQKFELPK